MGFKPTRVIWKNGEWVRWEDATVHVLAHGLHYGSSVFEGLRAYATPRGPAVFRNRDHVTRLFHSARMYGMEIGHSPDEVAEACREVIRRNDLASAYIRPIAYRSAGTLSLVPGTDAPVEIAIAAIEWGEYLGAGGVEHGIDVCVSSWRRLSSSASPVPSKAGGHYLNAQLIAGEAHQNGFGEGIALDESGKLSEGSGENLFLVRGNTIVTPPLSASVLEGITRDTVLKLAKRAGFRVVEQAMPREALYTADEVFLTGTAAEITPVRSVDRKPVGDSTPGPITRRLQRLFFGLFDGSTRDRYGWMDFVSPQEQMAEPQRNGCAVRMRD